MDNISVERAVNRFKSVKKQTKIPKKVNYQGQKREEN